jgi:hypothetical protein
MHSILRTVVFKIGTETAKHLSEFVQKRDQLLQEVSGGLDTDLGAGLQLTRKDSESDCATESRCADSKEPLCRTEHLRLNPLF